MDKISVIVPVYNVEPYIKKCLESIINQTYKNLEIICVNDGSTDGSGAICEEYAKKDNRIKVFHKANGGLSSARNVGLKNLTGNYIAFIDSDDWIEPNTFEVVCNLVKNTGASIGVFSYFMATDKESVPVIDLCRIPDGTISQNDMILYAFKKDYYKGFSQNVCNKIFSSELVFSSKLLFDENLKYAEDTIFYAQAVMSKGCTGVYCDRPLYHYYFRNSSLTNQNPLENMDYTLGVYKAVIRLLDDNGYGDVNIWVKRFHCYFAGVYAGLAAKGKNREALIKAQNEIKLYLNEYVETNMQHPDRIQWVNSLLETKI